VTVSVSLLAFVILYKLETNLEEEKNNHNCSGHPQKENGETFSGIT